MIDISKVRKWTVRFSSFPVLETLPFPEIIVEETEPADYRMPQCDPAHIPPEIGAQITVTLSGRGVFSVGSKQYDCLPGTAFCYRHCDPNVSYHTAPNCMWRFLWVNFYGIASERLIAEINHNFGYFFPLGRNNPLEQCLLDYQRYANFSLRLSPWDGANVVLDMIKMLLAGDGDGSRISPGAKLVNEVKEACRKSFGEPLTGESLARKIGVSREHLSKTFHQETGIQLRDYLFDQRLNEALSLLLKSNLSCKEIASICHYGSYSAFFRTFRKVYGVSPDEFRKGKKSADEADS